jgi:hypothetical protein
MKLILDLLALLNFGRMFDIVSDMCKLWLLKTCIGVVERGRSIYLAALLTTLCVFIFFAGFVMLHVALFLCLPLTLANKTLLLFILGGVYTLAPVVTLVCMNTRNQWLKRTGVEKLADELSRKK